ncbi:hypothetical protein BYT27DRAFT_6949184 [Phlegmacium glaucopus]|nr:hypothetical protein BYT27DRAFT_6949184 [Phlegmacium glaucopus]
MFPILSVRLTTDHLQISKNFTKSIWTIKTLFFSLAEAVLSASVFTPPRFYGLTPASLALALYPNLAELAQEDGDGSKYEAYVQSLSIDSDGVASSRKAPLEIDGPATDNLYFSRDMTSTSQVALASNQQLVPVLSDKCIRDWV